MSEPNAVFDALANETRRRLLIALSERDSTTSTDLDALGPTFEADHEARIRLTHVHLPLLDDLDVLTWHPTTGEVEPGPRFEEVLPFLEHSPGPLSLR